MPEGRHRATLVSVPSWINEVEVVTEVLVEVDVVVVDTVVVERRQKMKRSSIGDGAASTRCCDDSSSGTARSSTATLAITLSPNQECSNCIKSVQLPVPPPLIQVEKKPWKLTPWAPRAGSPPSQIPPWYHGACGRQPWRRRSWRARS